jgi:curved DNA-binding protein CbpA
MSDGEIIVGLGARTDYVAPIPNADLSRLTDEERGVLAAVGRASTIVEAISRSKLSEPKAIALLLALRAKGVIAPAKVKRPGSGEHPVVDAAMLEEVDLAPELKRELLDIERSLEWSNHYELLGVTADASEEEIRSAYHALSRKFHPDRYFQKNLGSFRGRLERIFKALSEANATLSDPDCRARYLQAHSDIASAPKGRQPAPEDPARAAERRARFAQHPYLAKGRRLHELIAQAKELLAKGDFLSAAAPLDLASQMDPKNAEVQALLAKVRQKKGSARAAAEVDRGQEAELLGNLALAAAAYRSAFNLDPKNAKAAAKAAALLLRAQDFREAKVLAEKAVMLEPGIASHRVLHGKILFELGLKKLAKKEFEEALRLNPGQAEAKDALKKLRWTF